MADYPFKHIEHVNYKNTFLQNVMVGISFKDKSDSFFDETFRKKLCAYLKNMFNVENGGEQIDFKTMGFTLTNEVNDVAMSFQNGRLEAKIGCKSYSGFVSAFSSVFVQFKLFLKNVLDVESVEELHERKVNIWQFESKDPLRYEDVAPNVFSPELNELETNLTIDPKVEDVIRKKIFWDFSISEQQYRTILKTAFLNKKEGFYHLILDSEVMEKKKQILVDDLDEDFVSINDVLFDAYHWAVSPKVIELMNNVTEG